MSGRDAGLQPERTALAWQRAAVAVLLLSVVLGWHAATLRSRVLLALTVLCGAAGAGAAVVVPRTVHGLAAPHPVRPFARLGVVVLATIVLSVAGAATALVSAGAHP